MHTRMCNARQNNTEHDRKIQVICLWKTYWERQSVEKRLIVELCRVRTVRAGAAAVARAALPRHSTISWLRNMCHYGHLSLFSLFTAARDVQTHGIHVERVPWAEGKERMTKSYRGFLARWRSVCRGKKRRRYLGRAGKAYNSRR